MALNDLVVKGEEAELYRLREQVRRLKEACELVLHHFPIGAELHVGGRRIDHTGVNVARTACHKALAFSNGERS
jgi:hypothetical protein